MAGDSDGKCMTPRVWSLLRQAEKPLGNQVPTAQQADVTGPQGTSPQTKVDFFPRSWRYRWLVRE